MSDYVVVQFEIPVHLIVPYMQRIELLNKELIKIKLLAEEDGIEFEPHELEFFDFDIHTNTQLYSQLLSMYQMIEEKRKIEASHKGNVPKDPEQYSQDVIQEVNNIITNMVKNA